MRGKWAFLFVLGLLAASMAAYAHHSFAATYDEAKTIEIKGRVVVFSFRNPHSFVTVEVTETSGQKLLVEEGQVRGVRTGDKGRDKEGGQKSNFEPGSDVIAKATVLAEGCWGHLTGAAQKGLGLAGNDPQVWALGVKEVWEVEKPLEKVMHTLGWPLRPQAKYQEFGGSWIYGMNREGETPKVSLGFVCGLDSTDARLSVHDLLQEFKLHPLVKKVLEGGKRVAWGAKAIPEGGYWAMPRLGGDGFCLIGDSGGFLDGQRL